VALCPRPKKGLNRKWLLTNRGPYRIMKRVNDVNYVVQRSPESQPEIEHTDRLSQFHGTIPPKWKKVVAKERTALEKQRSVLKDGRKNDHKMTETEGVNDLVLEDSDGNVLSADVVSDAADRPRGVNVTAEQPEPTRAGQPVDVTEAPLHTATNQNESKNWTNVFEEVD